MKDAVATMGDILPDDAGGRDAVHVAVISAVANERLFAGQEVGFDRMPNATSEGSASTKGTHLGIVDPFLKVPVQPGQRFWLYLYPRTITGLNHQWTHPAFPDAKAGTVYVPPSTKLQSEQWLKDFCDRSDCPGYHAVMGAIESGNGFEDEYLHFNGSDAHGEIPSEFWEHVENVLGRKFAKHPTYFSCSC